MSGTSIVKTLCRMCDDHCGIDCHVEEGKVVKIEGNQEHVWNRGRLCIKGSHGTDMIYAPDRIRKPLKKTENGFVEIPLKQALDESRKRSATSRQSMAPRRWAYGRGRRLALPRRKSWQDAGFMPSVHPTIFPMIRPALQDDGSDTPWYTEDGTPSRILKIPAVS